MNGRLALPTVAAILFVLGSNGHAQEDPNFAADLLAANMNKNYSHIINERERGISTNSIKTARSLGYATSDSWECWSALSKKWLRLKPSVQAIRKKQQQDKLSVYKRVALVPRRPHHRRTNPQHQIHQLGIRFYGMTFPIFLCSGLWRSPQSQRLAQRYLIQAIA